MDVPRDSRFMRRMKVVSLRSGGDPVSSTAPYFVDHLLSS